MMMFVKSTNLLENDPTGSHSIGIVRRFVEYNGRTEFVGENTATIVTFVATLTIIGGVNVELDVDVVVVVVVVVELLDVVVVVVVVVVDDVVVDVLVVDVLVVLVVVEVVVVEVVLEFVFTSKARSMDRPAYG